MMKRPLQLALCAAVLAVSINSNVAWARPTKIALTKVEGDVSGVGKAVTDALEDSELVIVPPKQVERTVVRLGLDDNFTDRGAAKLGEELEVDAVVRTAYDRRRNRMRFTIYANGKRVKPFSVEVVDAQSDKFRRVVRTAVLTRIATARKEADAAADAAGPATAEKPPAAKPAEPKIAAKPAGKDGKKPFTVAEPDAKASGPVTSTKAGTKPAAKDVAARPPATKPEEPSVAAPESTSQPVKPDAEPAEDAEPKGTKPADPPFAASAKTADTAPAGSNAKLAAAKPQLASARDDDGSDAAGSGTQVRVQAGDRNQPRSANLAAVRADLGVSMATRSLTFESSAANAPKPFTSAAFPGARVEAEIYPLGMDGSRGLLSGLGIAGTFDQAAPLTVHTAGAPNVDLAVTERHYSIGLRYRIAFGQTPTSPTLTVGAGYASRTFTIDRSKAANPASIDMPDVDYTLFDPGLSFRLPLGTRFAVSVAANGLIVADAGQIQKADQYGTATAMGLAGSAGLDIMLGKRIALRVAGEATQINFSFTGTGTLSNNRDGNPATVDVKKASDTYLGGVASLAVLY
jgi:hypothetical protein